MMALTNIFSYIIYGLPVYINQTKPKPVFQMKICFVFSFRFCNNYLNKRWTNIMTYPRNIVKKNNVFILPGGSSFRIGSWNSFYVTFVTNAPHKCIPTLRDSSTKLKHETVYTRTELDLHRKGWYEIHIQ